MANLVIRFGVLLGRLRGRASGNHMGFCFIKTILQSLWGCVPGYSVLFSFLRLYSKHWLSTLAALCVYGDKADVDRFGITSSNQV